MGYSELNEWIWKIDFFLKRVRFFDQTNSLYSYFQAIQNITNWKKDTTQNYGTEILAFLF